MKIKLKNIERIHNALASTAEKRLPIKISFAISKNMAKLQPEHELIQNARSELIRQYAKKDETGNYIIENNQIHLEDPESFYKELQEYLDSEIEVKIYQIPISELDKLDESRYDALTPAELSALGFIFEEGEQQ